MINGTHVVIYTKDREADRAFFRDVLKFPSVDAGHGWLIFAMPQLEAAFHDSEKNEQHELFLMCDNLDATLKGLKSKNVKISDPSGQRWGKLARLTLPSGARLDFTSRNIRVRSRHSARRRMIGSMPMDVF